MNFSRIFAVGCGSFLGGTLRYVISEHFAGHPSGFPIGTLLVNIVGGFLIGLIMEACARLGTVPDNARIFLTTGILGGLTTFSTFSYETISFFSGGRYLMGGLNAALNLFLALIACLLGKMAVQLVA